MDIYVDWDLDFDAFEAEMRKPVAPKSLHYWLHDLFMQYGYDIDDIYYRRSASGRTHLRFVIGDLSDAAGIDTQSDLLLYEFVFRTLAWDDKWRIIMDLRRIANRPTEHNRLWDVKVIGGIEKRAGEWKPLDDLWDWRVYAYTPDVTEWALPKDI